MYLEYFQLRDFPFRLTPDTEFMYMSEAHSRAKSYMDYTIRNRDGFVVITGEIGSGKTTLIQKLLSETQDDVMVAKIFQTQLDEVEFLQAVLVEFGMNPFHAKKVELIDMLNTFLIDQYHQQKQMVLVVDDAHNLSPKVLEEIRMLSGLETQKERLLHVILVGQPPLNDLLDAPELEQLLQRVRLRYHIKALSEDEMRAYITHRLKVAGMGDKHFFAADTFPIIHKYTGGLPRLINTLCDTALICAYADSHERVTVGVLNGAIEELNWLPYAKRVVAPRTNSTADNGYQEMMKDHTRALVNVGEQMTRLDALVPALSALAGRMGNIETLLRQLIGERPAPAPAKTPPPESVDRAKRKIAKSD
ncbi:MAG: AAA family ATPase [Gammaproteobacteria bacterium]|nr:AAA family ATPase [Gammaproteobacteria bacterium]